jgi:enoyl-CoA hydratase/carnithine racemase
MSQLSFSIDGELAKLVLHNPPQNRLTQAFFAELGEAIAEIGRSGARAALLSAEGPDFSFGGRIADTDSVNLGSNPGPPARESGSPGYYFPMCKNPRHSRGLGVPRNSHRQIADYSHMRLPPNQS